MKPTARPSLPALIAAWTAPVLVLGGFALLSGIPIAMVLIATLRDARLRALRWWSGALVAAYAVPVAFWQLGPSDAPSLTKYMNPAVTTILVATGVAVALAFHVQRRRTAARATAG
ncbi:hypothetical protein [Nonomuraea jabiensis]|uniref:Uncharacterized protein n=1 Tax=Nonomuraea jabiensis TaxID=882448 RepID=A0A7W9G4C9_9ACTN|nr:hypothetical protein [Nonomuraea jabiensis]MBB5776898.1 hypothetical protein [Nonomuraea jabiensis]